LVFVAGVNQVALLRINDVQDPAVATGRRGGGGGAQVAAAQLSEGERAFTQYCVACHGANQLGAIPGVPSLIGVSDRLDEEAVRTVVKEGRNHMRAIVDATNEEISAIYAWFQQTNPQRGGSNAAAVGRGVLPPGPVVARGGAP